MPRVALTTVLAAVAALLLSSQAAQCPGIPESWWQRVDNLVAVARKGRRVPAEELILERRIQGIEELVAAARKGPVIPFEQILVVVQEGLVERLIEAALPIEQTIESRYQVRVEKVRVTFEDNFALVRLGGKANLVDDPLTVAAIDVYGGLDVVDLDPASGVLRGQVKVLAVDTQSVDVRGFPAPVRRLVDDLGREGLSPFESLLDKIEIPVRIESALELPAVHDSGVHIEKASLPIAVRVVDVKALEGRLWVCASARWGAKAGVERTQ